MALKAFIRGTFKDSLDQPRASILVQFEPIGAPFVSSNDVIISDVVNVTTNASGYFGYFGNIGDINFELVGGSYRVIVSDVDAFEILVPGDGALHDIEDLVTKVYAPTSSGAGYTGPTPVSQQLDNSESIFQSQIGDAFKVRKRFVFFGEGPVDPDNDKFYSLLSSMVPSEIVVLGDLNTGGLAATIDAAIGKPFHAWMYPYTGAYGSGSADSANHFWYALGDQDWAPGNVNDTTAYVPTGTQRYYKVSMNGGTIALFVIDSNALEADGNTSTSVQGVWLQTQLAAATEKVKIVVFRDSPFASKTGYTFPAMNWPFAQWGATLVVAAGVKFVERITLDDNIPLFLVGGAWEESSADAIGSPYSSSQFRSNTNPAFLTLDINEYSVKAYFVNTAGEVLDENEIVLNAVSKVKLAVIASPNNGIIHATDGIKTDFGSADGQALGGTNSFIALQEGRIVRVSTLPSVSEVKATPWYKNCLFLVGDDPPDGIYYWNRAHDDFSLFCPPTFTTSYFSGAKPILDPPTLSPTGGQAVGVDITHAISGVIVKVSIDGSAFFDLDLATLTKVYFGSTEGPHWIAAYATKSGYEDSQIVTAQFHS